MVWVKRLLIALLALVVLVAVAVGALILLVDPNDYKQTLEDEVKARYNRTLAIDGDIRFSMIPSLGLEISGVALSEPGSNQMFAAMESARVSVAWWPLLSRHLVIEHLTVNGIKANLVRDEAGRFNFQDFIQESPQASTESATPQREDDQPSLQLNIGGITVNGGEVAISDAQSKTALRVERLSASASGIALGEPFAFNVSGRMLGQQPRADATIQAQGRMTLAPDAGAYAVQALDLRVAGMLPGVRANTFSMRGNVSFNTHTQALDVSSLIAAFQGDVALATPLTSVEANLSAPQLMVDLAHDLIKLEKLSFKAQGKAGAAPFTVALDAPQLHVTQTEASSGPLQLLFQLEGNTPLEGKLALSEIAGNAKRFEVGKFTFDARHKQGDRQVHLAGSTPVTGSLQDETVELGGISATLNVTDPGLPQGKLEIPVTGSAQANLDAEQLAARLDATINGGKFASSVQATGFDRPDIRFEINADTLDIDKFYPAAAVVRTEDPKAAEKPAEAPAPAQPAPAFASLNDVRVNGAVRAGRLLARGVVATDVSALVRVADGRATISDVSATLYEGTLSGSAFAEAGKGAVGLDARLSGVSILPLLKALADNDTLSGKGDLTVNVASVATSEASLRSNLDGTVHVHLRDGAIRGINIAQSLRDFKAMLGAGADARQDADRSLSTDFTELQGALALQKGVGTVQNLLVAAPLLRITEGQPATINLVDETLDVVLDARVVNTSTGQGGKALEQLRDVTIPVRIVGGFTEPDYEILWSRVSSQALKRVLQNEAERQLDRLLNRRENNNEGANPAGRILGDALKGIFN